MDVDCKIERVQSEYKNDNARYLLKNKPFGHQYVHIYASRLNGTKPVLTEQAKHKWDCNVLPQISLAEIGDRFV